MLSSIYFYLTANCLPNDAPSLHSDVTSSQKNSQTFSSSTLTRVIRLTYFKQLFQIVKLMTITKLTITKLTMQTFQLTETFKPPLASVKCLIIIYREVVRAYILIIPFANTFLSLSQCFKFNVLSNWDSFFRLTLLNKMLEHYWWKNRFKIIIHVKEEGINRKYLLNIY